MWVRVSTYAAEQIATRERYAEDAERMRAQFVPQLEAMEGFKGVMTAVDPASGSSLSLTFWETEEAMRASEEAANRMRKETADEAGETIVDVHRYELLMDERR